MLSAVLCLLVCVGSIGAITNNADLIWYDKETGEARDYFARQPYPEGFVKTDKIKVNQKVPVLYEVKFAFFDNLQALMIDDCGVNEVRENTFRDLKPLSNLSLAFNNIREIKEGVFNNVRVKDLNFSNNRIASIASGAFDRMPVLERINLDYNELKQWDSNWFFNSTRVVSVSITHNFIEELPKRAFQNFWIEQDSVSFYFSYNRIETIHKDCFEGTGSFGDLFLDWNDLPRVDSKIFGKIAHIDNLNLDGDSLRCLSEDFINNVLNKTKLISIQENPFKCECLNELRKREDKIQAKIVYSQQQTVYC